MQKALKSQFKVVTFRNDREEQVSFKFRFKC